jgi:hypothetical protein
MIFGSPVWQETTIRSAANAYSDVAPSSASMISVLGLGRHGHDDRDDEA